MYRMVEITNKLNTGANVFTAVTLSKAFSAFILLQYENNNTKTICFDSKTLKVKTDGPYKLWEFGVKEHGGKSEYYDSNKEFKGENEVGFDMSDWQTPIKTDVVTILSEQKSRAVVTEEVMPVRIYQNTYNRYVADFGTNMHGHIHLKFGGGDSNKKITIKYSERVYPDGELNPTTTINFNAGETGPHIDIYVPKGEEHEEYSPTFSNHGFRYAEILKFPGEPKEGDITAYRVHTPMQSKSYFSCSDDDINKLFSISYNSERSNLVTVPTDCPHRERLGWLGDQVCFIEAECINFNLRSMLEGYAETLLDDQFESGAVQYLSPFPDAKEDWCDIPWNAGCILVPWYAYDIYGDIHILEKCYPMMKKWIAFMDKTYKKENGIINGGICWNDHTAKIFMNEDYLATLYYYISVFYAAKIAEVLGFDEAESYFTKAEEAKNAINKIFKNEKGYSDNIQADNAHAINFSIADGEQKQIALNTLIETLKSDDMLFTCGALGINNIIPALANNGRNDIVYKLCKDKRNGSWGGWIDILGATTSLEYLSCDQLFSMNHPFLMGSITTWFYEQLGGIKRTSPAFKTFKINPYIPNDMEWANTTVDTPYGEINFRWEQTETSYNYIIDVPVSSEATIVFPTSAPSIITEKSGFAPEFENTDEKICCKLGSGHYEFCISK